MALDGTLQYFYSLASGANDMPRAIAETAEGNFIIVGETEFTDSQLDILILSISGDGNVQWTKGIGRTSSRD